MCHEVEAMLTREDEISLEVLLTNSRDVLTLGIDVLLSQTKVDHLDLVKVVLVALEGLWVTDQDIVKLNIIEGVASFVDELDLLE